jgi:23S rRNA pseudouridine2605 synthase
MANEIRHGRVHVNGTVVDDFRHPVSVERDRVTVGGRAVDLRPARKSYLMLNKPKGVLSTVSDERGRRTVIDVLPAKYRSKRLHPVGRLDKNSTGLLLLTNDGELTNRLTHPRFEHEKEYLVSIGSKLRPDEKRRLERGVELEDGITATAVVRKVNVGPFTYSLTIREGRKRQVRRMFAGLGHRVLELKRVRVGGLTLGDLEEGDVRELGPRQLEVLLGGHGPTGAAIVRDTAG